MNNRASIITTEKNEASNIGIFLDAIIKQTLIVDELVICDGGSTDGTIEIIKGYQLKHKFIKLITKPGNRSVGRNEAIRQAANEIIAITDVGTVADERWLEEITLPFNNHNTMAVAGFFKAQPETFFEKISATLLLWDHDNIDPKTWLPSCRSMAFRKEVWQNVGGFPEEYAHNEDTPFDLAVKAMGYQFAFAANAVVYWRPRSTLNGFVRQYHYYAIGDGEEMIFPIGYLKKTVIYLLFLFGVALGVYFVPALIGVGSLFLVYSSKWTLRVVKKFPGIHTFVLSTFLLMVFDVVTISGYFRGVFRRINAKK